MKMVIKTYWNVVEHKTIIHSDEFELKGTVYYDSCGFSCVEDFVKINKNRPDWVGEVSPNVFKFTEHTLYGIESYNLVELIK